MFCRSALLLSVCENRFCLSQLLKKLNSTERGAPFRHFCVSKVITTAHAHKSGVIFHFFPRAFKQKKIKALRPKMTKIASRGGGGPALMIADLSSCPAGSASGRTFRQKVITCTQILEMLKIGTF